MQRPLVAPRLRSGDRVGVVTPSWPVSMSPSPDPDAELEKGLETLRDLGFEPVLGEHALADRGYMAARPAQRASDINRFFADPSIGAVIASHGGHVAHGVLKHLDWDTIRSNPKIFMGFSNITTLTLAMHAVTGLVTFNGNMVIWHLGMDPSPYDLSEINAVLVEGRTGVVPKNSVWTTVRSGATGEGRLLGDATGLRGLAGTPYAMPLDEDLILFFEGMADPPGITETLLHHLDYMGVLARTRGVLIGNDGSAFTGGPPEVPFVDILLDVAERYDFPIVKCDDFGHGCPNTVLPIGARARLDPATATLEIMEPTVR